MGRCTVQVWANDPSRPLAINNLNHALVRVQLTNPANARRYNCTPEVIYTTSIDLNPLPRPVAVGGTNQINLNGNNFSGNDNLPTAPINLNGLTTQGVSGILGVSSFRLFINNKAGSSDSSIDKHAAFIINMINGIGVQSSSELAELSMSYNNNAVAVSFYIALRAIKPSLNHQTAIGIVRAKIQENTITRTGMVTGRTGIQRDIPIDTYYDGNSLLNPLIALGYSQF